MRTREYSEEVLFAKDQAITISRLDMEELKRRAKRNDRNRIRLCAHTDTSHILHEMFIVHTKDTYIRPHKHLERAESFQLIEGSAKVVFFDEEGDAVETVQMGDFSSGYAFYYRMDTPRYHTLVIDSDVLVFYECTSGPFDRNKTVFAPWSPEESDCAAVHRFREQLARVVGTRIC